MLKPLKGLSGEKRIIFGIKDIKVYTLLVFFYSGQAAKCSRIAPPVYGLDGTSGHKHAKAEQKSWSKEVFYSCQYNSLNQIQKKSVC